MAIIKLFSYTVIMCICSICWYCYCRCWDILFNIVSCFCSSFLCIPFFSPSSFSLSCISIIPYSLKNSPKGLILKRINDKTFRTKHYVMSSGPFHGSIARKEKLKRNTSKRLHKFYEGKCTSRDAEKTFSAVTCTRRKLKNFRYFKGEQRFVTKL